MAQRLIGIRVERRVFLFPTALEVGPALCEDVLGTEDCCEDITGGGGGFSSSSSSQVLDSPPVETVTVVCCVDPVPTHLQFTITSGGSCDGTHTLVYQPGTGRWLSSLAPIGSCIIDVEFYCLSAGLGATGWRFVPSLSVYSSVSAVCEPFSVVFTGVSFAFCGGGGAAVVTVTTPP